MGWGSHGCVVGRSSSWRYSLLHAKTPDRKSTRLNSSHLGISYAVFCLKKKKVIHLEDSEVHPCRLHVSAKFVVGPLYKTIHFYRISQMKLNLMIESLRVLIGSLCRKFI